MAEWSNAPDSKSGIRLYRIEGSNPSLSAKKPVLLSLIEFQKINKIKGLIEFHCLILSSLVLGNLSYVDVCLDE